MCKLHPKYKGVRPPASGCTGCWRQWLENNKPLARMIYELITEVEKGIILNRECLSCGKPSFLAMCDECAKEYEKTHFPIIDLPDLPGKRGKYAHKK